MPDGVVVANDKGDVYVLRLRDGQEIRSFSSRDHIRAPLAQSDTVVYFSSMNHSIWAVDLEGGFWREMWCYDTERSSATCN
jgi:outer membrane protein assembly factor BamB